MEKIKTAILNPINLVMPILILFAGLCAAWWMVPIGIVIWIAMLILFSVDPETKIKDGIKKRTPVAYRFQKVMDNIEKSQLRIYNAIQHKKDTRYRKAFRPIMKAVNKMIDHAFLLADRMTLVENHRLISTSTYDVEKEIKQINLKIEQQKDDLILREQCEIKESLENRLAKLQQMDRELELAEFELQSIQTELSNVLTEVVRMQSLPLNEFEEPTQNILIALDREIEQTINYGRKFEEVDKNSD